MIPRFRGISISDENKGQWVYGNLIVDGNYAYIVNGVIECNDQYITIAEWCPVGLKTIGASTGLFDKNGVEIFEGDLLRMDDGSKGLIKVGAVESGNFAVKTFLSTECSAYIAGNIHEHPHLLETKEDNQ